MTIASFRSTGEFLSDEVRLYGECRGVESGATDHLGAWSYERCPSKAVLPQGKADSIPDLLPVTKTFSPCQGNCLRDTRIRESTYQPPLTQ